MSKYIIVALLILFFIVNLFGIGFMALVEDVREDKKWDKIIRKEQKDGQ